MKRKYNIHMPEYTFDQAKVDAEVKKIIEQKEQLHNDILRISEKNLSELEIFGLKVILNEKLKLTRKERNLLECHGDIYIARDKEGILYLYTKEPREQQYPDMWLTDDGIGLILSDDIFNFITWESGKAWSKAELMELEVVE